MKPTTRSKVGARRRRRKEGDPSIGLAAVELQAATPPDHVRALQHHIDADGGTSLAVYREPFGGRWLVLAALPIEVVAATPFQRNLSEAHVRQLETVISRIGRFLDPLIVVRASSSAEDAVPYWTPNGHHRLTAMRTLGAKSITAVVVPEVAVAYQILALNTEKAHNLREKALEVIRLYREFARVGETTEEVCALEFEEPGLITLGLCDEARPRFSGGAYHPVLRRVDTYVSRSCRDALRIREGRAQALLALDEMIVEKVAVLKRRGLTSPYVKSFVVARVNPIRFRPKEAEPLSFEEAIERMTRAARNFNPDKVRTEDVVRSGGAPDDSDGL